MNQKTIKVLHLYAKDMNIYGDYGNVLTVKKRLEWYGYQPKIIGYNQGDVFPDDIDIIIGGGGQDSGQNKIQDDLLSIGEKLHAYANKNTPMLVVCGLYQLFGKYFKTRQQDIIKGIGIFNAHTVAGDERLIGNIVVHSEQFGDIIGYENHSGQTFLEPKTLALGRVRLGAGNNTKAISEGARYKNTIGTYLHGSLLPKNPLIADYLIEQAVINKYGKFEKSKNINDSLSAKARKIAVKRPR